MALSVAPALRQMPPAVSRHAALWRPDFPPGAKLRTQQLPNRAVSHSMAVPLVPLIAVSRIPLSLS